MVFLGPIPSEYLSHPSCNTHIDDVIRSNIPTVFSVFLFLSLGGSLIVLMLTAEEEGVLS